MGEQTVCLLYIHMPNRLNNFKEVYPAACWKAFLTLYTFRNVMVPGAKSL